MNGFDRALALLPPAAAKTAAGLTPEEREAAEELRLRRGRAMTFVTAGREYALGGEPVTADMLRYVAERATGASFHAAESQLRRGYLSAPGGVRIGVCGTAVMGACSPEGLRDLSSMAIRIPRQTKGCADGIWPALTAGGFASTLVIGSPGAGKTTLLRELIRKLSEAGYRVAAADERGELGGSGFELGPCTDVLTGWPKASAAVMLLRTMTPQVVALDEITDRADALAAAQAAGCGVELLASVHGYDAEDIRRRRVCRELLEQGVFCRYVTVRVKDGRRAYETGRFS